MHISCVIVEHCIRDILGALKAMNTVKNKPTGAINGITEGAISKQLLLFFFPILFGTFFQQLYNTVDAIVVGRCVGKLALSAVGGTTSTIINLFIGFFTGLSSGCAVALSQSYGAQKKDEVSKCIHTALSFSVIVGICLMIFGFIFSKQILMLMKTPDEILPLATAYLRIYFLGMVGNLIYNMGAALLRAAGDSKRPLIYLIAACTVNIVLDILFVAYMDMGIAGAAIATIASQAISAILVMIQLCKTDDIYRVTLSKIKMHPQTFKRMVGIGFPAGLQSTMYNAANIIIQVAVNTLGTDSIAAWATLGKVDSLYWMIMQAFGIDATTFVGQNFGAGKMERSKKGIKYCLLMCLVATAAICLLMVFGARIIYSVFTDDASVIAIGENLLRFLGPTYFTYILIEIYSASLKATGDCWIPTLMTCMGVCVLRIVWIAIAIPKSPSIMTVAWAYPISWSITSILFAIYFHKYSIFSKHYKKLNVQVN